MYLCHQGSDLTLKKAKGLPQGVVRWDVGSLQNAVRHSCAETRWAKECVVNLKKCLHPTTFFSSYPTGLRSFFASCLNIKKYDPGKV